jgi:gamma-glutamylcyclotransferase (GGCT)/AIG2-like uncharacterized protein YtfP
MSPAEKPDSIFVYGTLKRTGSRRHLWPWHPLRIVPARIQGLLYDLGPYPALVRPGTDWVAGERWQIAPEDLLDTLHALDNVEGYAGRPDDVYHRCIAECIDEDRSTHRVYLYQFAHPERLPTTARRILPNAQQLCIWPEER